MVLADAGLARESIGLACLRMEDRVRRCVVFLFLPFFLSFLHRLFFHSNSQKPDSVQSQMNFFGCPFLIGRSVSYKCALSSKLTCWPSSFISLGSACHHTSCSSTTELAQGSGSRSLADVFTFSSPIHCYGTSSPSDVGRYMFYVPTRCIYKYAKVAVQSWYFWSPLGSTMATPAASLCQVSIL